MSEQATRRSGDQLRGELLDAATAVLAARLAVAPPSLRETARACGVSPTAVYRHFPSQQSLVAAVADRALASLAGALEAAAGAAASGLPALHAMAVAYTGWAVGNPGAYQLLFEGRDQMPDATRLDAGIDALEQRLVDLLVRLLPDGSPVEAVAERLWVALHGLVVVRIRKVAQVWARPLNEESVAMVDLVVRAEARQPSA